MNKIKIGIIGTGYIGNVHARIFSRDERAEIAALFDIVPEKAARTARSVGGKVCASREEFLESCDAVLVTTPNKTHVEIASEAVEAGKHVFCEKPFAIGLEDAHRLLETAKTERAFFRLGIIAVTPRFTRNLRNYWAKIERTRLTLR
jgi:predicted dehydrogenase